MEHYDVLIVGGGAAGIAAARGAAGKRVLLAERRPCLGGILLQCVHNGFGKAQTGPEYAKSLLEAFPEQVELALNTSVTQIAPHRIATLCSPEKGCYAVSFSKLILATGCREIPMGVLPIAGTRPRGVYTAGQLQEMMNMDAFCPEGPAVILGSGDLGLVMAWQLARIGIEVSLVEQKSALGGMARNQRRLEGLPVKKLLETTITEVRGWPHLEQVVLADGRILPCKTLLIAVGLRPEQGLCRETGQQPWLRLCGNASRIHPIVEAVVQEGRDAGAWAAEGENV